MLFRSQSVTIGKKEEGGVQKDIKADVVADIWLTKASFGVYEVGFTDYPIEIDVARELEADRDNFLKEIDAKLVSESDITQNGFSGKEFTGTNSTYTFKCRVFAGHRRIDDTGYVPRSCQGEGHVATEQTGASVDRPGRRDVVFLR